MQAIVHKRDGFRLDAEVAEYQRRLDICKHYNIGWLDFERLSDDDVTKAGLYFEAKAEAYAAAHPTTG